MQREERAEVVLGVVQEELALEVAQELVLETVQGIEDARQLVRRQRQVMEDDRLVQPDLPGLRVERE